MSRRSTGVLKAALAAMHYSGASRLAAPLTSGAGVIFMLHHVSPKPVEGFEPNRILRVHPDFLEDVICRVRGAGFDIIGLDEVPTRLSEAAVGEGRKAPFACFTFDDGYRDNRDYALPVFKRHGVPFTVYVPTGFADGHADLWWLNLELAIGKKNKIEVLRDGGVWQFNTETPEAKYSAFHEIYWWLRSLNEQEARGIVRDLVASADLDANEAGCRLVMSWDELREFSREPLVQIGAHTCTHRALSKLDLDEARREISVSIERIEHELGLSCRHFSYPYGSVCAAGEREFELARELGVKTAVTTRKGLLHAHHADALTALPRLSLNGDFQDWRYTNVLLSGMPFALANAWERVSQPVLRSAS